jgi:hypothetical protein
MTDREEIRAGLARGDTLTAIARHLGRAASTISREAEKNGGRAHHRAYSAPACRPLRSPAEVAKLAARPTLRAADEEWLDELWSPEQIARRLRLEHPGDPMMSVRHETIYQSLFVQERGALKRELIKCLRTGRVEGRPGGRTKAERRGQIPGKVMISERPAEVFDRARPRPVGGRPDRRRQSPLGDPDARRAHQSLRPAAPPRRVERRGRPAELARRPDSTDATAAPSGGHPIRIVVADDIAFVAHLRNAGRPYRRRQPTTFDRPDQLSGRQAKKALDSRGHLGNAEYACPLAWGTSVYSAPRGTTSESIRGCRIG